MEKKVVWCLIFPLWHQIYDSLWLQLLPSNCILFPWPLAKGLWHLSTFTISCVSHHPLWEVLSPPLPTLLTAVPSLNLFIWTIFIWIQLSTKSLTDTTFIDNHEIYIGIEYMNSSSFFFDGNIYGWLLFPSIYVLYFYIFILNKNIL